MTSRGVYVTGSSTGIGRAAVLHLAGAGWTVFAGVRRKADGEALVAEKAGDVVPVIVDVTDPKQIASAARTIGEHVGTRGLDALVNNAGVAVALPLEFVPIEEFRHQLDVNVVGPLAVTQSVLPLLRTAKGRIVNITSIGGLIAGGMLGPYHASKFALEAMTDTLRIELAQWGIEVVAIEPGQIATPIWATSGNTADRILEGVDGVNELYGPGMAGARRMAASAAKNGLDPIEVAKVIERALTAKRPRTRYPVGTDAKVGAAIIAKLPDRTRDRLMVSRRS
ncbi:MAG: SDR family oxidoreductase [Pseudolysinimonas sp.]